MGRNLRKHSTHSTITNQVSFHVEKEEILHSAKNAQVSHPKMRNVWHLQKFHLIQYPAALRPKILVPSQIEKFLIFAKISPKTIPCCSTPQNPWCCTQKRKFLRLAKISPKTIPYCCTLQNPRAYWLTDLHTNSHSFCVSQGQEQPRTGVLIGFPKISNLDSHLVSHYSLTNRVPNLPSHLLP